MKVAMKARRNLLPYRELLSGLLADEGGGVIVAIGLPDSWSLPGLLGDERGTVGVVVATFLAVILGFAGLVIDVGHLFVVRSNLQNVADAASLAAAATLGYGPEEARNQAQLIALRHGIDGTSVTLALADIELGTWDIETKTFTVLDPAQEQNADSVRVTAQRAETRDNPVPLFFMPIFGRETSDVRAMAVATRNGDCIAGVIGETRVTINSSAGTDSYDSSFGPYSAASPGQNGDVCSCGDIELNSSALVQGDAQPGYDHEVILNSSAYVTGSTAPGDCPVLPDVELGDIATNNDNADIPAETDNDEDPFPNGPYALELTNGDSITLDGGTSENPARYYFTSLELHSSTTLSFTGPAIIYVTETFALNSSSILNPTQNPEDLVIMISSTAEVQFNSSTDFHGVVYAPNAHVINNSSVDFFGAIFGQEVTLNSSVVVHYDETLDEVDYLDGLQVATGSGGGASSSLVR